MNDRLMPSLADCCCQSACHNFSYTSGQVATWQQLSLFSWKSTDHIKCIL